MELVYVYIGTINNRECNFGINFGIKYEANYDQKAREITIKEKSSQNVCQKLYGNNIYSVDVLVGRNGVGKTTILELLGLYDVDRVNKFDGHKADGNDSWFAIYYVGENKFYIEGCTVELIQDNIYKNIKKVYSLNANIDKIENNNKLVIIGVSSTPASLIILMKNNEVEYPWWSSSDKIQHKDSKSKILAFRNYVRKSKNIDIMKLLSDTNEELLKYLDINVGGDIYLRSKDYINEDYKECNNFLYGDKAENILINNYKVNHLLKKKVKFSNIEIIVLNYLENIVWYYYKSLHEFLEDDEIIELKKQFSYLNKSFNLNMLDFSSRKQYLLKFLYVITKYNKIYMKRLGFNLEQEYETIEKIVNALMEIPENLVKDYEYICVPFSSAEYLFSIAGLYDDCYNRGYYVDNSKILPIIYEGLSTGEAAIIDLLAALNTSLNEENKSHCILLLDEPDRNIHPEWCRQFLYILTKFLAKYTKLSFQIIITTHSPIMLSDIPRERIKCLEKYIDDKGDVNVICQESQNGFMSNINEIMLESFFMKSSFGEVSRQFVSSILNKIKLLDMNNYNDLADEIKEEIRLINEPIIRMELLRKLEAKIYHC